MNMKPHFDLTGRVAIITGASRGIGLAIARAYSAAGAHVVLASRSQEAVDLAAAEISGGHGDVLPIAAHTGDPAAAGILVERTVDAFGRVDILVNNAATNPHFGPLLTADEGQWDKILDINLKGYVRMIKACVEVMARGGGGSIINMASIAGLEPQPGMGVYSVSKAAVIMLTKVLAAELAPRGIRSNAIAPGLVRTKFSELLWSDARIHDAIAASIPQKRIAEPEEIAGIALYLASDASSFTTGAVFVIDGGQMVGTSIAL
jgi:NAD(P)-dependent dehydrogenase (short-subunit alcohol dehydrogenase family)